MIDTLLPISPSFFRHSDPLPIARSLIGHYILSEKEGRLTGGRIVETEAYKAPEDKACHAHLNRRTQRTRVMFEKGGTIYVYLCYGIHHLLNIVTGSSGMAHAILIRAIDPLIGTEVMAARRSDRPRKEWTNGPGKLTQALGITIEDNAESLFSSSAPLRILRPPDHSPTADIVAAPRIGVDYAEECAAWPWRFLDPNSPFVSVSAPTSQQ